MKQRIAVFLMFLLVAVVPVWAQGSMSQQEIERISQSVVQIGAEQGGEIAWTGSGTIVSPTGLIYTNRHVTEGAEDFVILMIEDDMNELPVIKYRARLVAQFSSMDFAILQIDRNANGGVVIPTSLDLPFLTPEANEVSRGEHIYVFGFPGIGNGYLVLTEGAITTAQNGTIGGERMVVWYQTDAEIAPGNSGGLAVTSSGELVGIPTAVDSEDRTSGRLGGLLPFRAVMALAESGEDIVAAPTPGGNTQVSGTASTEITNIEHNVEQGGEVGMVVHTYMRVAGYKDAGLVAGVFFYDTADALVEASELAGAEFVASNGLLRAVADLNPGFDDTEYTDLTFWVPYNAFPLGLSGDVSFFAEADIFDGENWIAPSQRFELILEYGDTNSQSNQNSNQSTVSVPGVTATCGNINITNGVEIIVRQMRPGFNYTATAVGIGGFDPVLIVRDSTDINDMLCSDDEANAAKFQMNLPSTGNVGASNTSAQLVFNHSNANMTDISLIVGSFDGSPGEFVLLLEGMAVTREDGGGDPFTLNGTSSMANSDVPLSVYMIGTERQLDPRFSVVDYPSLDVWLDTDDIQIVCDDAGTTSCWDTASSLNGFQVGRANRGIITADAQDSMLQLPVQQLDPQPMTFLMSSYNRETTGLYMIAFHIGLN